MALKTITLRGVRYVVIDDHLEGFADVPVRRQRRRRRDLYIDAATKGTRKHLEIALHESLHALAPDSPESWVDMAAHQQARLVWGLDYRIKESKFDD